jgi:hypothetical protein
MSCLVFDNFLSAFVFPSDDDPQQGGLVRDFRFYFQFYRLGLTLECSQGMSV